MSDRDRYALMGILESISKIETYLCSKTTFKEFESDTKTIDACLMNVVTIGEMVSRLSDGFITEHINIDWSNIRGLRNVIAHDYFGVDLKELYSILSIHVPKLKEYIIALI